MAVNKLQDWTSRLVTELNACPPATDVISYVKLKGISDAATELLYTAGHVNAAILSGAINRSKRKPK